MGYLKLDVDIPKRSARLSLAFSNVIKEFMESDAETAEIDESAIKSFGYLHVNSLYGTLKNHVQRFNYPVEILMRKQRIFLKKTNNN